MTPNETERSLIRCKQIAEKIEGSGSDMAHIHELNARLEALVAAICGKKVTEKFVAVVRSIMTTDVVDEGPLQDTYAKALEDLKELLGAPDCYGQVEKRYYL